MIKLYKNSIKKSENYKKDLKKGSKRNTDWEGRNITLFGDDTPSHVENPKELTPKNK